LSAERATTDEFRAGSREKRKAVFDKNKFPLSSLSSEILSLVIFTT
jgi:hypothetical protein